MQTIIKQATFVLGNPYVTNGLVAQFDGIWNVGLGRHDPNATEWTNLVTGQRTISTKTTEFAPTGYKILPRTNIIDLNTPAAVRAVVGGKFTIEVVGSIDSLSQARFYWINDRPNSATDQFCLFTHVSSSIFSLLKLGDIPNINSHGSDTIPGTGYGNIVANLINKSSSNVMFYKNGSLYTNRCCTVDLTPSGLYIVSAFKDRGPTGIYHALRIYNRPLSEAEVATNCEIDRARFHF